MKRTLVFTLLAFCAMLGAGNRVANKTAGGGAPVTTPEFAWYKFNEGTGTSVADSSSGGTAVATIANAGQWTTGPAGYVFTGAITGNSSSYRLSSIGNITFSSATSVTVGFWVSSTNYAAATAILFETTANAFGNPGALVIFADTDNKLWLAVSGSTSGYYYGSIAAPSTSTWHYLMVHFNQATPSISATIDGSSVTFTSAGGTPAGVAGLQNAAIYMLARGGSANWSNAKVTGLRVWSGNQLAQGPTIFASPQ